MRILCILRSEESYKRIRLNVNEANINWDFEKEFQNIKNAASIGFDLVVIDSNISEYEGIIQLFERINTKLIIFNGNYEDVVESIKSKYKVFSDSERYILPVADNSDEEIVFEDGKPVRILYKEVIKEKRIEVPVVQQQYNNTVIAVVNLSERAGSTFVSSNLARAFSKTGKTVTLIESPISKTPYYFYSFDLYPSTEGIYSPFEEINHNRKVEDFMFEERKGVKFAIKSPNNNELEWDKEKSLRLLYQLNKNICIYDLGYEFEEESTYEIVKNSDLVLVIIDPNPADILINQERLYKLHKMREEDTLPIEFVYNKWSKTINEKKFVQAIEQESFFKVPFISPEVVYSSVYSKEFVYAVDQSEELEKSFETIKRYFFSEEEIKEGKLKKKFRVPFFN